MTIGIGVIAGVTSPIWGGAIKDQLTRRKKVKEGIIPKDRPVLEDFYDRAEVFIEAYTMEQEGLKRGYGETYKMSFEGARNLIDDRNEMIKANVYKEKYEFKCPVCDRKNYRLQNIKTTSFDCRCPAHEKLRKFVQTVENSR
jgi:hypothetical protein